MNNESYNILKELLDNMNFIINKEDNKCLLKNDENFSKMKNNILEFYKILIFEVLKKKICKKIKNNIVLMKKNKGKIDYEKLIKEEVLKLFEIINLCKEIITGEKLIDLNEKFNSDILKKEFIIYIQKLK